jgi:hypothetical protein
MFDRYQIARCMAGPAVASILMAAPPAAAQIVVQNIEALGGAHGANPEDSLAADANGVLYGTTTGGGSAKDGVVFTLTPPAAGKTAWVPKILHNFAGNSDGDDPLASVALFNGVVYGTTFVGGSGPNGCYADGLGCGTVFQLTPPHATIKGWTYKVLHRFAPTQAANDGAMPQSGFYIDSSGNLYGTTSQGGGSSCTAPGVGCGVFYKITAKGAYSIIYRFQGGADANNPGYNLTPGPGGVLYGVSQFGGNTGSTCIWGTLGCGTVFSLTPNATATAWSESVLYRFTGGADGSNPGAALAVDSKGILYGSTSFGGAGKDGVVFRLLPPGTGSTGWHEQVLHAFTGGAADGAAPGAQLTLASTGLLLGTTPVGAGTGCAASEGCGMIFTLTEPANHAVPWKETILHKFNGGSGGGETTAGFVVTKLGVFSTTLVGGAAGNAGGTGNGTVYQILDQIGSCGGC